MSRQVAAHALLAAMWFTLVWLPTHAATYRIDPRDTTAHFEVLFLGVFPIRGEFRRTTGTLIYDAASRQGSIEVFIDTTTLEASTAGAQESARGPHFFDVDKYPSIDFKSSRFVFDENRLASVEGNLTLVGKTRPVVLIVTESRCAGATEQEPAHCRAAAELQVKRSDFGMKAWSHTVEEEVTIRIVIAARQVAEKEVAREMPTDALHETPKLLPETVPPNPRAGGDNREALKPR